MYTDPSPVPSSKLKSILLHIRSVQLFRAYLLNRSREKTETREKTNNKQQASLQKASSSIHNECFTTISHQVQTKKRCKGFADQSQVRKGGAGGLSWNLFFVLKIWEHLIFDGRWG